LSGSGAAQGRSIAATTAAPASRAAAVAVSVSAAISAAAVAAFPVRVSLLALAVPSVFAVVAAAVGHPGLVIEKHLTAAAPTRAAVPAILPCLTSRCRVTPTAAVSPAAVAAATWRRFFEVFFLQEVRNKVIRYQFLKVRVLKETILL
jgi:hypothetical protein